MRESVDQLSSEKERIELQLKRAAARKESPATLLRQYAKDQRKDVPDDFVTVWGWALGAIVVWLCYQVMWQLAAMAAGGLLIGGAIFAAECWACRPRVAKPAKCGRIWLADKRRAASEDELQVLRDLGLYED